MTDYQPLIARAVDGLGKSTGEARRALYERARAALVAQLRAVEPALSESEITRERLALEEAIRKVEADAARKLRTDQRPEPRIERRPSAPPMRPMTEDTAPQTSPPPPAPATPPVPPRRDRPSPSAGERPLGRRAEPLQPVENRDEPTPEPPPAAAQPTARSRLLNARSSPLSQDGIKGFRGVVNEVDDLGAAAAKAAKSARDTRELLWTCIFATNAASRRTDAAAFVA